MSFKREFKEFAIKGNAIDLAVGVIIGGAFNTIIKSLIDDLIMPLVGAVIGKPDFSSLYWVLKGEVAKGLPLAEARKVADATIFAYGNFITVFINFFLLALVIFFMVKGINKLKKKEAEKPKPAPTPSNEEKLLEEIRDLMKKG